MSRATTASLEYSAYIKMLDPQGFMASALLYADDVLLLAPLLVIIMTPPPLLVVLCIKPKGRAPNLFATVSMVIPGRCLIQTVASVFLRLGSRGALSLKLGQEFL